MYFVLVCLEIIFFFFLTESQSTFNSEPPVLPGIYLDHSLNINYFVRKEATCQWICLYSRWAGTVISEDQESLRSGIKDQADDAVDL